MSEKFKLQGEIEFQGLHIMVENRKGSVRRGVSDNGKAWETKMKYPYGYISRTKAADDEHVDCYVGDSRDSEKVYVVHQVDPDTKKYDEDKVMLGFENAKAAKAAYLEHYDSPDFFGSMTEMTVDRLKKSLKENKGKKLKKALIMEAFESEDFEKTIQIANLKRQANAINYFSDTPTPTVETVVEEEVELTKAEQDEVNEIIGIEKKYELEKGKKVPIGTITGKYKKVAEGKWQPTKSGEHKAAVKEESGEAKVIGKTDTGKKIYDKVDHPSHSKFTVDEIFQADKIHKEYMKGNKKDLKKSDDEEVEKGYTVVGLEKAEKTAAQSKVNKVMKEFKAGTLKSSDGKTVADRDQAIAIAMSEAGIKKANLLSSTMTKGEAMEILGIKE